VAFKIMICDFERMAEKETCDLKPVMFCDRLPTSATKAISFLAGMEGMGWQARD
jgi:hypothetical protein